MKILRYDFGTQQESVPNSSSLFGWLGEQPAGYNLNQLIAA